MRGLRLLILLFLFCVDVHVKAAELKECWGEKLPCPVKASEGQKSLTAKNLILVMSWQSLLEQRDEKTIELVQGNFYVETSRSVRFQTPYAKVWCEGECKGLFSRDLLQLDVRSLEGRWLLSRTGETQIYTVPPGLQVEVGEVTTEGQAQMEFPQSLPWAPTAKLWGALYPGTVAQFKQTLAKFRPVWKEAVEAVSEMHQTAARRTLAAYAKEEADRTRARQAKEREDESLRRLFREKNP